MTLLLAVVIGMFLGSPLVTNLSGVLGTSEYTFFHENVLGTSLELKVRANSSETANCAEATVLKEIDRLSDIFSGYNSDSEFSLWQKKPGQALKVSDELFEILCLADEWLEKSRGTFDPRVQVLSSLWSEKATQNRTPTTTEIHQALARMNRPAWILDPVAKTAQRIGDSPLSLNAIAKGYIVERACEKTLGSVNGVSGIVLNLGGDMRACGDATAQIGVIDPNADSESSAPMETIEVRDRAIATSGRSQRGFRIQGQWFSHIFDPRTGRPAEGTAGATVIARRSADADALATILNVMTPAEGLRLVEALDDVQCMIVGTDGHVTKSQGWDCHRVLGVLKAVAPNRIVKVKDKDWDADYELAIDFEINNPGGNNRRYRRPYVAIWVEDKNGKPVRTLTLWLSLGGAGPDRWLPDMKKWYVVDQKVKEDAKIDLVHTLARPTRQPGKYSVVWDGKDDQGNLVGSGEYTISIEAAREHGTYQIIRKAVTFVGKPFAEELKGNAEIKSASLAYRRKAATK